MDAQDINKQLIYSLGQMLNEEVEPEVGDRIDTLTMTVPLFIRMMEFAREDAGADLPLHKVTENALKLHRKTSVLSSDNYDEIVANSDAAKNEA